MSDDVVEREDLETTAEPIESFDPEPTTGPEPASDGSTPHPAEVPHPRAGPVESGPIPMASSLAPTDASAAGPGAPAVTAVRDLPTQLVRTISRTPRRLGVTLLAAAGVNVALIIALTAVIAVSLTPTNPPDVVVLPPSARHGVVHDSGPDGLRLRVRPSVAGDSPAGVPDGDGLDVLCGQAGQLVTDVRSGVERSSTVWLRTVEGRFASSLYVDLGEPTTIANCRTGQPDLSLVAVRQTG